jgi:hypothetical protein
LTAAHCALAIGAEDNGYFELDGKVWFTFQIYVHPDYDPISAENDIAVLELEEEVTDVSPMPRLEFPPEVGDELAIVGYGAGGDANGEDGTFGEKMVAFTAVEFVDAIFVLWEFNDPDEGNTAPGDSGGPGLLTIDGVDYVATVTLGGADPDAALGDLAFNARVDIYVEWIEEIIEAFYFPPDEEDGNDDEEEEPCLDDDYKQGHFGRHPYKQAKHTQKPKELVRDKSGRRSSHAEAARGSPSLGRGPRYQTQSRQQIRRAPRYGGTARSAGRRR